MKKIFTILVFILMCYNGYSQSWYPEPTFAGQIRGRSGAFAIGDTGYIIAGGNTWYLPDSWGYDSLTGQWFQIADYPGYDDDPISCAINGKGYCVTGGSCCPAYSNMLYQYDPNTNTWTQMASLPGAQRTFAVGFAIDSDLYVGGGVNDSSTVSNSNPLHDFWKYNVYTQVWTQIASCPAAGVNAFAVGFAINGKGYLGTGGSCTYGNSNYTPQQDFWEYDPSSNTWTQKANFGGGVRAGAVGWATCNKGFIGTGYTDVNQSIYTKDVWEFDPVQNTWTQIANYGGLARKFASVFTIGSTAFVGNGTISTVNTDTFYAYHPDYIPAFLAGGASSPDTICAGQTVSFIDTSNYVPTNWYWQFPGGTPYTSTVQNPTITYDTPGVYNVSLSAWNNCDSGSQTFTDYITVNPAGALTVEPSSSSVPCGESVTLNVTTAGTEFTWAPSMGLNNTTGDTVVAAPTLTTIYTVNGASSGGCSLIGYDTVTVTAALPFTILPVDTGFCSGQNAILYVSGGGSDFIWTPIGGITDSTLYLNQDSITVSPTITTTYKITGVNPQGCPSAGTDLVTIIPSPIKPSFTQHGDTLISSSNFDNEWYRNDTLLNDTGQYLIINTPGWYFVLVFNEANGCSTASDSVLVKPSGIEQLSLINNQFSVYPNPTSNLLTITGKQLLMTGVEVTDVLGQLMYKTPSMDIGLTKQVIDFSSLDDGVYFVTVITAQGQGVFKIVKE